MSAEGRYIRQAGFTLIELSIVLVIIGLIVGGVLVGQDLMRGAEVRATITQIEKYNQAVNTFRGKYNALPGDMNAQMASQFGFIARGSLPGEGDGNGIIEGITSNGANCGFCSSSGEESVFWVDLSTASLIDGGFNTATEAYGPNAAPVTGNGIGAYFPSAKLGKGNYIYVWAGGYNENFNNITQLGSNGLNYFGLSAVTQLYYYEVSSSPGLTVAQAYAMDKKLDDGLPQSGNVTAMFLNYNSPTLWPPVWAGSGNTIGAPYTTATAGSSSTCFDNGGNAGTAQQYSVEISNGANVNCALSFRFQ